MLKKLIAKRYADAFLIAIHEDDFESCFRDFEAFVALYFGYDGLSEILNHPTIHLNRKIDLLCKIFGKTAEKRVLDFICLLVKRKRINLLERIAEEIEREYRQEKNITGFLVKSAVPLLKEERTRLYKVLEKKFGKIQVREVVDREVLGGIVVYFSEQVIDDSIRARLQQLKDLMARIDSEWLATILNQPSLAI